MRILSLLALLSLVSACGGSTEAPPAPEAAPEAAPEPEPEAGSAVPDWKILTPSPLELEAEVEAAGIKDLAKHVPAEIPKATYGDDKDLAALHTGVVFSWTLLGGRTSEKGMFLTQVRAMRTGMETIGAGQGTLATLDRSIEAIQNDAAAREDFLKELDAQVQSSEEGWGPNDTSGPLLQAGAWLAGIHIVAEAVVAADDAAAADKLLKRGDVAAFFLKYLEGQEGAEKAGPTAQAIRGALADLKAVSERDSVGIDGAREIVDITGKLLKLL